MNLEILMEKTISEIQKDFSNAYPYLRIDFYRNSGNHKDKLLQSMRLKSVGLKHQGDLDLWDSMTVGKLEQAFKEDFGLNVQVSRRSGIIWLETTMTDGWTLKQQNDHGRELSTS